MERRPVHHVSLLLVEDNPSDAELTLRVLGKHRLADRAYLVRDGAEALEFLFATGRYASRDARDTPRVIFLDLKLPKVGGLEVLRAVRSDPRTRMVPVIVLTSSREAQDIADSYRLGVNSYVVKPVDFGAFERTVVDLGRYWLRLNEPPD
ncbi:MAG TPA: response regulator [Gemmatimonadales bacterium]|nr:response regulator [Gemmatimonadales bacterium]